ETNWVDVAAGCLVLFAVNSDGSLWACGEDAPRFTGVRGSPATLARVGTDTEWEKCCCCGSLNLAVFMKKDHSLWNLKLKTGELRPVPLSRKNWVAIAGGAGGAAVALTRDGEVWTWGLMLGEHTPEFRSLEFVSRLLGRVGLKVQWGTPQPITRATPWQLHNLDPTTSGSD
ncbi:MAG: hypothetical protein KGS61_08625, partial [Verrucomicrobia bacterium]|nr:hypothetical protein [Verrucomicrobiota bacterium]